MRLKDLRVVTGHAPDTRPATLEELVEVLKEQGAKEVRFTNFEGERGMWISEAADSGPGRYLVLPLDGTTPK